MTTVTDIVNAIQALAATNIKGLQRIYTNLVPKDFLRPCLLIELANIESNDANKTTISVDVYITMTVYCKTNDFSNSDMGSLLELQDEILKLFRSGSLAVGDRALHVQASTGGRDFDKAYIDVHLDFFDDRDDKSDTTPLMEEVKTNIQPEGV